MITILLVNLVGVTIYVAGVGMCLRATKRTGNHGYLLLAAYFAAVLVVSSLEQVRNLERGPDPAALEAPVSLVGYTDRIEAEEAAEAVEKPVGEEAVAEATAEKPVADPVPAPAKSTVPLPEYEEYMPTVSPPILPAILLVGVFLISRDDPRRRREEAEEAKQTGEAA